MQSTVRKRTNTIQSCPKCSNFRCFGERLVSKMLSRNLHTYLRQQSFRNNQDSSFLRKIEGVVGFFFRALIQIVRSIENPF